MKGGLNIKKRPHALQDGKASFSMGRKAVNPLARDSDDDEPVAKPLNEQQRVNALLKKRNTAVEEPTDELFDYDKHYETAKQLELHRKRLKDGDGADKRPKYMADLIKASHQRKADFERAQQRKLQREREAEGEMFGETEGKNPLLLCITRTCKLLVSKGSNSHCTHS